AALADEAAAPPAVGAVLDLDQPLAVAQRGLDAATARAIAGRAADGEGPRRGAAAGARAAALAPLPPHLAAHTALGFELVDEYLAHRRLLPPHERAGGPGSMRDEPAVAAAPIAEAVVEQPRGRLRENAVGLRELPELLRRVRIVRDVGMQRPGARPEGTLDRLAVGVALDAADLAVVARDGGGRGVAHPLVSSGPAGRRPVPESRPKPLSKCAHERVAAIGLLCRARGRGRSRRRRGRPRARRREPPDGDAADAAGVDPDGDASDAAPAARSARACSPGAGSPGPGSAGSRRRARRDAASARGGDAAASQLAGNLASCAGVGPRGRRRRVYGPV